MTKRRTFQSCSRIPLEVQIFGGEGRMTVKVYSSSTLLHGKVHQMKLASSHKIRLTDFDDSGDGARSQLTRCLCTNEKNVLFLLVAAVLHWGTQSVRGAQAGFQPPRTTEWLHFFRATVQRDNPQKSLDSNRTTKSFPWFKPGKFHCTQVLGN